MTTTDHLEGERPDKELVESLFHRSKTTYLLIALLMLIILFPTWEDSRFSGIVNGVFIVSIAVTGLYAVSSSRMAVGLALALGLPALSIDAYHALHPEEVAWALIVVPLLVSSFFGVIFAHVFGHVLKRGTVSADKLHGAVCGYILLGFGWASLYLLIERVSPGSFIVSEAHGTDGVPNVNDLLYKSFTTLTTTGYGDVLAVTSAAQSFAILEQIVGVFYVAIIIARLAGAYPPDPGKMISARGTKMLRHKHKR